MAEIKITDLPEVTAPLLTDEITIVQGGVTKTCTLADLQLLWFGGVVILSPGGASKINVYNQGNMACNKGDILVHCDYYILYISTATNTWTKVGTQFS